MTISTPAFDDRTLQAYEELAPFYDLFTAGYGYETLLTGIERLALDHGLTGRRLLDVGCGTGKSFLPMLARGYDVTGCDLSPAMVDQAREKLPPGLVELFVADMRDLPVAGPFDLITCLDDSLNYLVDPADLVSALRGMAANLAPGGLLAFDVTTLSAYRGLFTAQAVRETDGVVFCWRGQADQSCSAGSPVNAQLDVFREESDGAWSRVSVHHHQRHLPRAELELALRDAGLELVAVSGMVAGGHLQAEADEDRHNKLVFVARAGAGAALREPPGGEPVILQI
jgi:SAM-dependent methyltransferase